MNDLDDLFQRLLAGDDLPIDQLYGLCDLLRRGARGIAMVESEDGRSVEYFASNLSAREALRFLASVLQHAADAG